MKHTKLFTLFSLLIAGVFVLAACGSSPATTAAPANQEKSAATATPAPSVKSTTATGMMGADTEMTGADTEMMGTDTEHNDGDEHAADTEMTGADTGMMSADTEHNDGDEHAADTEMAGADAEHNDSEHEHTDVPEAYANKTNPLKDNPDAIAAGAQIYTTYCAACHGVEGKGDGPAGTALEPHPANLADAKMMNNMSDTYLFWRISEGGMIEPFNSAMPPWKGSLTEEQRWQVIDYLRTLAK